jgi:putative transposase
VPERPTSWQTFLRAHWDAIAGADFFTTEVWTWRGLVTFYTVFVIDLTSRRVHIVGSTPHPDERFMQHVVRTLTTVEDGPRVQHHMLICDRDTKWSAPVRARLDEAGIRVVQTPYQTPNANAYAERFVRSIKQECLSRVIPFFERLTRYQMRRTLVLSRSQTQNSRRQAGVPLNLGNSNPRTEQLYVRDAATAASRVRETSPGPMS